MKVLIKDYHPMGLQKRVAELTRQESRLMPLGCDRKCAGIAAGCLLDSVWTCVCKSWRAERRLLEESFAALQCP